MEKMTMKKNLAIVGLMFVLANLGSVKAQAAQSGLTNQSEPFTIRVSVDLSEYASADDGREELKAEAAERCYGHPFTIDNSSIGYKRYMIPNTGFDPKFAIRVTARVFCMNY